MNFTGLNTAVPFAANLNALPRFSKCPPAWTKYSTSPRYGFEELESNVSNMILSPLAASQI
jgi:hypothetical protein